MRRIILIVVGGLAALIGLGTVAIMIAARNAQPPIPVGVSNGKLAACPDSPNCVSTQSTDELHGLAPLPYSGETDKARSQALAILQGLPRMIILREEPTYIHALFRSPTMGFPDDFEIFFDEQAGQIHFRAAARMGRGDMGVNRNRAEQIRSELEQRLRQ
ncbi:MAG TPA: DUF1499 domain-containing protein [Roseiflexaceae bacterium]|nr:DUF1499 domain-containing protein [Roseiflexaceae bacterium]